MKNIFKLSIGFLITAVAFTSCNDQNSSRSKGALNTSNAEKVYVAPGEHDSHYAFLSGGFNCLRLAFWQNV